MILHITQRAHWKTAVSAGTYRTTTLEKDGFIHCATPQQVLGPANRLFFGQEGLVLLCIAPDRVTAEIIYEDLYDHGEPFPHIYGPINLDAVERVLDFPPQDDGSFLLPDELAAG